MNGWQGSGRTAVLFLLAGTLVAGVLVLLLVWGIDRFVSGLFARGA